MSDRSYSKLPAPALWVIFDHVQYLRAMRKPIVATDGLARQVEAALDKMDLRYKCKLAKEDASIRIYPTNPLGGQTWLVDIRDLAELTKEEVVCLEVLEG